jgi:hypothetical protein
VLYVSTVSFPSDTSKRLSHLGLEHEIGWLGPEKIRSGEFITDRLKVTRVRIEEHIQVDLVSSRFPSILTHLMNTCLEHVIDGLLSWIHSTTLSFSQKYHGSCARNWSLGCLGGRIAP